ncbi:hypothetical protein P4S68_08155 [Pseudoalteromonas sp. Hal099]
MRGQIEALSTLAFTDTGSLSESISKYAYDQVGIINVFAGLQDGDYFGVGDVKVAAKQRRAVCSIALSSIRCSSLLRNVHS